MLAKPKSSVQANRIPSTPKVDLGKVVRWLRLDASEIAPIWASITCNTVAASITFLHSGPLDCVSATSSGSSKFTSGTSPGVGWTPTTPAPAAGNRVEPPPSLPIAMGTNAAAAAEPPPELDHPVTRLASHGFRASSSQL